MGTDLTRIGEKARKEPRLVFSSLFHHISDVENLRDSYETLEAGKATGIDGVDKEEYGKRLEANLQELSQKLKDMAYRPSPKRRVYIPKAGSEKGRPLGISNLEDKIVEAATKRTLEPIYETMFEPCSYGYRPNRSPHMCVDDLGRTIQQKKVSHVLEADIRSFFDKVQHEWLVKFLRHRIGDERVIRLIIRMLKGGVLEDGLVKASEEGTPQGSILSPLLSNIYLHYVLDLWFEKKIKPSLRGEAYLFRFADDFVVCFEYKDTAETFRKLLEERMEGFGLELAGEKTKRMEFGKFARQDAAKRGEKPEEFTFLGFTFYCGKTKTGYFKVKRKTSRKKLGLSLQKFTEWAKKSRRILKKKQMIKRAKARVVGHLQYYAITDNLDRCSYYIHCTRRILFKWLNRKSQRKAYTWANFDKVLAEAKWPRPRIYKVLNTFRRAEAL